MGGFFLKPRKRVASLWCQHWTRWPSFIWPSRAFLLPPRSTLWWGSQLLFLTAPSACQLLFQAFLKQKTMHVLGGYMCLWCATKAVVFSFSTHTNTKLKAAFLAPSLPCHFRNLYAKLFFLLSSLPVCSPAVQSQHWSAIPASLTKTSSKQQQAHYCPCLSLCMGGGGGERMNEQASDAGSGLMHT